MPRAAILKGYANHILPLDSIGQYLTAHFGGERSSDRHEHHDRPEKFDRPDKHDREDHSGKNEKLEKFSVPTNRS